jgi:carbon-monoxide dehydrogenase medium subunit
MRQLEEYFRPETAEEAVDIKRRLGAGAVFLGGGTDLLVHRPSAVHAVIDIRRADISDLSEDEVYHRIGGGALLRDVERRFGHVASGMLTRAVRDTAPWLIRNSATLAGNLANASPAADSVPALLALDAELLLLGASEERVPAGDILIGPHRTTLGDRLITAILIPLAAGRRLAAFHKLARSKSDIALVNLAVSFRAENNRLHDVRIALGAVAPTVMRARRAEAYLEGKELDQSTLRDVEEAVCAEVMPISDWRASADYRRRMSGLLVRRALERAAGATSEGARS